MLSEKWLIVSVLSLWFIAMAGGALVFIGVGWARYLVYFAVPLGAVLTIVASVVASLGKVRKDTE